MVYLALMQVPVPSFKDFSMIFVLQLIDEASPAYLFYPCLPARSTTPGGGFVAAHQVYTYGGPANECR